MAQLAQRSFARRQQEQSTTQAVEEVTEEVSQETEAVETKPDPTNTRAERARRALLREGREFDAEVKSRGRDGAIRYGLKRAREQDQHAADRAELERLRSATNAANGQGSGGAEEDQSSLRATNGATQSRVPAPKVDFDKLAEPFGEFGDDARAKAKEAFQGVLNPLLSEVAQLRAANEQKAAEGGEAAVKRIAEDVRAQLSVRYPALKQDDKFEAAMGDVLELFEMPRFKRIPDFSERLAVALEEACGPQFQALEEVGEHDDSSERQGAARRGIMDTTGSAQRRERPPQSDSDAFVRTATKVMERRLRAG